MRETSGRTVARLAGRVVLTISAGLFASLLVLVGALLFLSRGTPQPFLDGRGRQSAESISEKINVDINGVEQGMFIKGRNTRTPVLLYLHGGMPDYFLTEHYPTGLDEYFTVAWWEQRGSGLSYNPDIPPESLNPAQLVSDPVAVTNYLRRRFGQEGSSSSRPTWSRPFLRGRRPNITMMSQNSHLKGQPRENCSEAMEYRSSFRRSKRGIGDSARATVPSSRDIATAMANPGCPQLGHAWHRSEIDEYRHETVTMKGRYWGIVNRCGNFGRPLALPFEQTRAVFTDASSPRCNHHEGMKP